MHHIILIFFLSACDNTVVQTESCAQWVSCIDARDVELGIETNNDRFLTTGNCWNNPDIGALCDKACTSGLVYMQENYGDLPTECLQ